jgi:hypothetical protein
LPVTTRALLYPPCRFSPPVISRDYHNRESIDAYSTYVYYYDRNYLCAFLTLKNPLPDDGRTTDRRKA